MLSSTFDLIRTWKADGFKLDLYDTYQTRHGKDILAYQFFHNGELIFEGDDFGCSPLHAIDSDAAVGGLLAFLSLKPGDTDPEYFESYTPKQMAFALAHGEDLSLYVEELESPEPHRGHVLSCPCEECVGA